MTKPSYVYMMASEPYGTLYIGVTADLLQRVAQHRNKACEGFTRKYALQILVWFEQHAAIIDAITREKQLKKWHRAWKVNLIQSINPAWRDLYLDFTA